MLKGYLIKWSWLNIFINGCFCAIEIDIRLGRTTYTHQFFTNKGFYNHFSYSKKVYEVSDSDSKGRNINTFTL